MSLKLKPSQLTVCLTIGLVIKTSRSLAQSEDYGSYLHQFYREDDHRMSIDTDTAGFDIGVGSHVRLQGQLVLDSISGATPNGAPPQSQWQYRTFNSYYNQAYNSVFQAAINDPGNYALYTGGYFANYQAYTNYIAQNNPQLATQATNAAVNQYSAITNNAQYHNSKQVPLTQLHDLRRAASFSVPLTYDIHQLTPQVSISKESDYHSYGFALDYALQLNKKNTTLNIGWSHDSDRVRDDTLVNWQGKVSDDVLIGINQLLTPKSYFTVNVTYGQEYGYLDDPYRGIMIEVPGNDAYAQTDPNNASLFLDNRPRYRNKQILYGGYTQYFDAPRGSVDASYRFFHDSFGVFSHTIDVAWHQKILKNLIFTPEFRYYYQTAATFYYAYIVAPDPSLIPSHYSADYRLSELQSFDMSATLTYRVQKHFSIDASYSRYIMQGLDGVTSQSAYPSANVYTIGGRIWF